MLMRDDMCARRWLSSLYWTNRNAFWILRGMQVAYASSIVCMCGGCYYYF